MSESIYAMAGRMARPFLLKIARDERLGILVPAEAAQERDRCLDEALDAAYEVAWIEGRAELVHA